MSDSKTPQSRNVESRWPHRLAWVLACAVFPLIWMGGLVTSYDAGMAVPDWPTTRGHWFYPLQEWLWQFNDLFLEHGHRTIAQLVGLLAIVLAIVLWRVESRRWMRWLGVVVLLGVIFQGVLGGLRVLFADLTLAKVHGCTAPLFFGLCTAMVTFTSTTWRQRPSAVANPEAAGLHRRTVIVSAAVYLLIVLGVQLRQLSPEAWIGWFAIWVWTKLTMVAVLIGLVAWLVSFVMRRFKNEPILRRRVGLLVGLLTVQLLLGLATWVVNYGFPGWFREYIWAVDYTVASKGPLQAWTTTAHTAVGSLSLVAAVNLSIWSYRLFRASSKH